MSSEESGYYHFNSDGKRGKNKWDAFDVDAELAKLDSDDEDEAERQRQRDQRMREKRAAKEREAQAKASADAPSAASDKADAAPSDAGDAKLALHGGGGGGGGAELSLFGGDADEENSIVHRFFNFAMGTVNITMNPFFERHIDAFDDLDDVSAKGESLEQWDIYKSYEAELETHFAKFVEREGFASAFQEASGRYAVAVDADVHFDAQRPYHEAGDTTAPNDSTIGGHCEGGIKCEIEGAVEGVIEAVDSVKKLS